MGVFGQDPERYLKELGITVKSVVNPQSDAVLEPSHRSYLNHDVFFFANLQEKEAFDREPLRYVSLTRDPVSGMLFRPTAGSPVLEHAGRRFVFASDSTSTLFAATPDSFLIARHHMLPPPVAPPGK